MKFKEIFLLILIVAAGIFFYHAQTGKIDVDWDLDGHFLFGWDEFTYEVTEIFDPPFPSKLQIINSHGDVEIEGTEEGGISILFQKIIWRRNEEKAQEISDKLKMMVEKDEERWIITTNRSEFRRKRFETNFRISVPLGTEIEVKNSHGLVKTFRVGNTNIYNSHGKVTASGIDGELIIKNSYRDVEVEDVQKNCRVDSRHSKVTIYDVKGEVKVGNRYGKIRLENISQSVEIQSSNTEVFGQNLMSNVEIATSYRNVELIDVGPTKITSSHARIDVEGAEESLDIYHRYGKIKLNDIKGDLHVDGKNATVLGKTIIGERISISSSYRNIELAEFSGETTISLAHGDVILEPYPLTHPVKVEGSYAGIKFYWPHQEKYPFEARAKNGDIKWNLPVDLSFQKENGVKTIKAFTQEVEKPSIYLSTSYRTITVDEYPKDVQEL